VAAITFAATTSGGRAFNAGAPDALLPGECINYTGSYQPAGTGAALCGPFTDTISAEGHATQDSAGNPIVGAPLVRNTDPCYDANFVSSGPRPPVTATCHVQTRPAIDLVQTCGPVNPPCDNRPNSVRPGEQYFEQFVVTNTGDVPLQNVVVHDTVNGVTTDINIFTAAGSTCLGATQLNPQQSCTVRVIKTA